MVKGFVCPQCGANGVKVVRSMNLPASERSDDIILQITQCNSCSFQGLALYEESRRGAMGSESWEHTGFWVLEPVIEKVEEIFSRCPDVQDKRCPCAAHKEAVEAVVRGKKWPLAILDLMGCEQTFNMRY